MIGRLIANLVDCALNRFAPIDVHARSYLAMTDVGRQADRLADIEADMDTWDPRLQPWEQELRDAYIESHLNADYANDILTLPPDQTLDEFVAGNPDLFDTDQPAGAVANPPTASGPGGSPLNAVATVIAVVLRGQGINSAPIYADFIARELAHHFDIQPK